MEKGADENYVRIPRKIFIVDGDEFCGVLHREYVREYFSEVETVFFADGFQAWEHIQKNRRRICGNDILIANYRTPSMSGPELSKKIQEAAIPLRVYMYAEKSSVVEFAKKDADILSHIIKPSIRGLWNHIYDHI